MHIHEKIKRDYNYILRCLIHRHQNILVAPLENLNVASFEGYELLAYLCFFLNEVVRRLTHSFSLCSHSLSILPSGLSFRDHLHLYFATASLHNLSVTLQSMKFCSL